MFFNIIDKEKFDILMTFSWNAQSFLYYPAIQLILLSKKEPPHVEIFPISTLSSW